MTEAQLNVLYREKTGKQAVKSILKEGKVPAIFYGHHEDSVPLTVDAKEMERLIHTEVNIIDVKFSDNKEKRCIIKEVQRDPVTDILIHVDIMGINLKEKVRLSIPVIFVGSPIGVKDEGGILEHTLREVEVEGLPLDIPEHIELDVSELHLGQGITVKDVDIAEGVSIHADPNQSLAHVVITKVAKAATEEELVEEGEEEVEEGAEEAQAEEE